MMNEGGRGAPHESSHKGVFSDWVRYGDEWCQII